ncbi:hypothetical protein [Bacillus sp. CECT 9360]|uniref:hypothetical protein n=1 Tax=Bacillus sp. CECT 9360 TaxID=2845821 RepID=UPI001E470077|nr:hypothetical protein [Bacillus sp. CECT 9360]CAH0345482.1 hypothetical protein BCI9360_01768 [Bacillus sp. CECT 9360]
MKKNIFAYSFDKKPDPRQWTALKNRLSSSYSLPDTEMLSNLHRSTIPITTLPVHEWLENDKEITFKDEEELLKQIGHLLPEDYIIPDVIRLKNIFIK